jgi:hypothetical protein
MGKPQTRLLATKNASDLVVQQELDLEFLVEP